MLKLAQILIDRIESGEDVNHPLPVVFNLLEWTREKQPFKDWLTEKLSKHPYYVDKKIIKDWIKQQKLLLLLDGLDEVDRKYRQSCVQYLYDFINKHGQTEIVICCRIQDYEYLKHLGYTQLYFAFNI